MSSIIKEGSGPLGSLRRTARLEVRRHQKSNATLISARRPLGVRLLQKLLGGRSFPRILVSYVILVVLLLTGEVVLITAGDMAGFSLGDNTLDVRAVLKGITGYFLAAQITAIGLLFPIAVALVTLIVQREEASSTNSDVQIYYHESLAYRIGASGIALSIVLTGHLIWPLQEIIEGDFRLIPSTQPVEILLAVLHMLWLITNLAALWHFFVISLSFIRPAERAALRRYYAAGAAIPRELSDSIFQGLYSKFSRSVLPVSSGGVVDEPGPALYFNSIFDLDGRGEPEVYAPRAIDKELHDAWLKPLMWAVRRWWKRSQYHAEQQGREFAASLVFLPSPGIPLRQPGVICRRRGGVPMTLLERLLIRQSFRFRSRWP